MPSGRSLFVYRFADRLLYKLCSATGSIHDCGVLKKMVCSARMTTVALLFLALAFTAAESGKDYAGKTSKSFHLATATFNLLCF